MLNYRVTGPTGTQLSLPMAPDASVRDLYEGVADGLGLEDGSFDLLVGYPPLPCALDLGAPLAGSSVHPKERIKVQLTDVARTEEEAAAAAAPPPHHPKFKEGDKVEVQSRYLPDLWVDGEVGGLNAPTKEPWERYDVRTKWNHVLRVVAPERLRSRTRPEAEDVVTEDAKALECHTLNLLGWEAAHSNTLLNMLPFTEPVDVGYLVDYDAAADGNYREGYVVRKVNKRDQTVDVEDEATGQTVLKVSRSQVRMRHSQLWRDAESEYPPKVQIALQERMWCIAKQAHGPDAAATLDALQSLIETRLEHAKASDGAETIPLARRLVAGREHLSATENASNTPTQAAQALALLEAACARWFTSPEAMAAFAEQRVQAATLCYSDYAAGLAALKEAHAGYAQTPDTQERQAALDGLSTEIAAWEALAASSGGVSDAAAVAAIAAAIGGPGGFKVGDRVEVYDRDAYDRWGFNGVFTIQQVNADGTYTVHNATTNTTWTNLACSELRLAQTC